MRKGYFPRRRRPRPARKDPEIRIRPGADKRLKNVFAQIGVPAATPFVPDTFQTEAVDAVARALEACNRPVVLIMGGRSGVGHLGIQIAKLYNCTVIATASPQNADLCKNLGADYVVNHRDEGWVKEVRGICKEIAKKVGGAPGIDVSFDHVGETHFNAQLTLLKFGGTLVSCGATTGFDATIDLRHVFFKGTNILGSTQGTKAELEQGFYWMGQGKIKSAIGAEYTFAQAAEAYKQFLSGEGLFGKIIIKP